MTRSIQPRVRFFCSENTARSRTARVLPEHPARDRFQVHSAGLEPGELDPLTLRALQQRGLPAGYLGPEPGKPYLGRAHFNCLITLCDRAEKNGRVFPGVSYRPAWPFRDPAAAEGTQDEQPAVFRRVRDGAGERLARWLAAPGLRA